MRALQHYTDLVDIKRVIVNTHAIDPQALTEFFGSLSAEWALDCLKVRAVCFCSLGHECTQQVETAQSSKVCTAMQLVLAHGGVLGRYAPQVMQSSACSMHICLPVRCLSLHYMLHRPTVPPLASASPVEGAVRNDCQPAQCASLLTTLPCLQELLTSNMQQNLQLVVQVAKEYTEQLGAGKIIELLEGHKSYHGLYYYLGSYIAFSEDPEVHYK